MSDENPPAPGPPVPGPEHHNLKPFEGTFRAKVAIHFGPGQTMESTGTMINSWQLGGLYLHQDYRGDQVDGPFPAFMGKGYWGYNTRTRKYVGFWIDNASTTMQMETGEVDESGTVWTMKSSFVHPPSGQTINKRSVIILQDDDHHRMEVYFAHVDEPESKHMEIEYVRT